MRKKVNDLLASGASYAYILRALGEDNAKLDRRDRLTVDSVRTIAGGISRCNRSPTRPTGTSSNGGLGRTRFDFVQGVATALTPFAFFEVVMTKAFRDPGGRSTPRSAWRPACEPPRSFSPSSTGVTRGTEVLELKVQLGNISKAVRSVVPQSMWAAIVEKLEELEQHPEALDVGEDGFDDADDDPYDPMEFAESDDEF